MLGLLMGSYDTKQRRKWFVIICSAVLVFVAALRSPEYMTNTYSIDSAGYKYTFEESLNMGWREFQDVFLGRYVNLTDDYDIGFIALQMIIGLFTHDFYVYSLLADLLFFVPFGIILYRYTTNMKQLIFAFIFYIALVQVYLFSGARQVFAIGFDLIALLAIMDRKKLVTIVFYLIGISIHFSSFLFAIPLLMIWFKTSPKTLKRLHVACFILFPIVFMMPNQIITFMGNASGLEKYAEYGTGSIQGGANTFILLIEMLSLFCLVAIKEKDIVQSKMLQCFYVMVPLFTLLAPLVRSNGTMIRISLYYSIFLTLLTPYAIECMFNKGQKTLVYVVVIGSLALLAIPGMTYYFYWQGY